MSAFTVTTFDEALEVIDRFQHVTHVTCCQNRTLMLTRGGALVYITGDKYAFFSVTTQLPDGVITEHRAPTLQETVQ